MSDVPGFIGVPAGGRPRRYCLIVVSYVRYCLRGVKPQHRARRTRNCVAEGDRSRTCETSIQPSHAWSIGIFIIHSTSRIASYWKADARSSLVRSQVFRAMRPSVSLHSKASSALAAFLCSPAGRDITDATPSDRCGLVSALTENFELPADRDISRSVNNDIHLAACNRDPKASDWVRRERMREGYQ